MHIGYNGCCPPSLEQPYLCLKSTKKQRCMSQGPTGVRVVDVAPASACPVMGGRWDSSWRGMQVSGASPPCCSPAAALTYPAWLSRMCTHQVPQLLASLPGYWTPHLLSRSHFAELCHAGCHHQLMAERTAGMLHVRLPVSGTGALQPDQLLEQLLTKHHVQPYFRNSFAMACIPALQQTHALPATSTCLQAYCCPVKTLNRLAYPAPGLDVPSLDAGDADDKRQAQPL